MCRSCITFDIPSCCAHLPDTTQRPLYHVPTAHTACENHSERVESPTLSATAEAVGTAAALWLRRTRRQQASRARAAASSCGTSPAASVGKPMMPEAHRVVQPVVDGLRATGLIIKQRTVAMGWSAGVSAAPSCSAEEPIRLSRHRLQTASRSWSVGRAPSCTARGTLHLMPAAAPKPLS